MAESGALDRRFDAQATGFAILAAKFGYAFPPIGSRMPQGCPAPDQGQRLPFFCLGLSFWTVNWFEISDKGNKIIKATDTHATVPPPPPLPPLTGHPITPVLCLFLQKYIDLLIPF